MEQCAVIRLGSGIDEMPKSEIEKRKRNMKSKFRVSRREKRNVKICFLVREENENFCKKNREICNHFSSFEMRKRNLNIFSNFEKRKRNFTNISHDSRGDRDVKISNFLWQEREIHIPPFPFYFSSVLKTKYHLRHKEEFWCLIPE